MLILNERICRELGLKDGLQASLGNQANILYARGDLDGAMALYKEQERICRQLGLKEGLARSLANQALVLTKMGQRQDALRLAEEAHRLTTRHGLASLTQYTREVRDYVRR
jgi:tetratricopeptide (TPR) repeat protein